MTLDRDVGFCLLTATVGLSLHVESDDYGESPGYGDEVLSRHKVVFRVQEEEPDGDALGILFSLACMSFLDAKPRGTSDKDYDPKEDWSLGHFVQGLGFERGMLRFSADYVSGRCMKTEIACEPGGRVTLETRNRARSADRWLLALQGKRHLAVVDPGHSDASGK